MKAIQKATIVGIITVIIYLSVVVITTPALEPLAAISAAFQLNAIVIIGMGIIDAINPAKTGNYSIEFSVVYALVFSLLCIIFAVIWRKYKTSGPLEWIMRKITD